MNGYTTDEETVEELRKWWRENGAWIIGGVALGAAVLFGWRYWTEWRETQLARASDAYEQVLAASAAGQQARALELDAAIAGLRLPTPYEDLSALAVARGAALGGDTAAAEAELSALVAQSAEPGLVHLARLRLARLQLAGDQHDAAAATLAVADGGSFAPLYAELRGDLALARGDRDAAIAAYRDALAGASDGIVDRAMIEMKLDNLGAAAPAQGA